MGEEGGGGAQRLDLQQILHHVLSGHVRVQPVHYSHRLSANRHIRAPVVRHVVRAAAHAASFITHDIFPYEKTDHEGAHYQ